MIIDSFASNKRIPVVVIYLASLIPLFLSQTAMGINYQQDRLAWKVFLEHEEIVAIDNASTLAPIPEPSVKAAITAASKILVVADKAGGEKGAEITGIFGVGFTVVTPAGLSPYEELRKAGGTVSDSAKSGLGIISERLERAGADISNGFKNLVRMDRGNRGTRHAGVTALSSNPDGERTSYHIFVLDGGEIALLSHQGFLACQDPKDGGIYGDASMIGPWERYRIEKHNGDSISLFNPYHGRYVFCDQGGGSVCGCSKEKAASWESFVFEDSDDGAFALKTAAKNNYVRVGD